MQLPTTTTSTRKLARGAFDARPLGGGRFLQQQQRRQRCGVMASASSRGGGGGGGGADNAHGKQQQQREKKQDDDLSPSAAARRVAAAAAAVAVSLGALLAPPSALPPLPLAPAPASARARLTPEEQLTVDVFKRSVPSVVNVTNLAVRRDAFTMNMLEIPQGAGSGFVWDDAGHVVTNYHVIQDASDIQVTALGGDEYSARVIGVDRDKDVAVLQVVGRPGGGGAGAGSPGAGGAGNGAAGARPTVRPQDGGGGGGGGGVLGDPYGANAQQQQGQQQQQREQQQPTQQQQQQQQQQASQQQASQQQQQPQPPQLPPPPPEALKALKPLRLCSSSADLAVGQKVFAIGNPFGLDHTLTVGVVSGTGREIQSISGRPIQDAIQTDAAINPGNSGGPLLDSSGCLIGINTAIYSPSGANSGVGFAIPVDVVRSSVTQIIATGRVVRPVLGISFAPDQSTEQLGVKGVLVLSAREGGPAWRAGVRGTSRDDYGRLVLGDIITAVDGTRVKGSSDLYRALDKARVGDKLDIEVLRGDSEEHLTAVLEASAP